MVWVNTNFPGNHFYNKFWAKSTKFRGKSKNFWKMLMLTDLNLVFLKSLGSQKLKKSLPDSQKTSLVSLFKVSGGLSSLCPELVTAVLYCNYWKKVSNNVKVFGSIQKWQKNISQSMKQQIWQNLQIRWHLQFWQFFKILNNV